MLATDLPEGDLRRFLRWLLGLQMYADEDAFRTLARRLDDVQDAQEHLQRRFTRLQVQVTRWAQQVDEEQEDDEEDDDEVLREIRRVQRG